VLSHASSVPNDLSGEISQVGFGLTMIMLLLLAMGTGFHVF